jgi:hypothetical protein
MEAAQLISLPGGQLGSAPRISISGNASVRDMTASHVLVDTGSMHVVEHPTIYSPGRNTTIRYDDTCTICDKVYNNHDVCTQILTLLAVDSA